MHVVKVERGRPDLRLVASVGWGVHGKETVPEMVATAPREVGTPPAAVNGDYFTFLKEPRYFGTPLG